MSDIDANEIVKSDLIFLEGYLWDEGPKKAFEKAMKNASKLLCRYQTSFVLIGTKVIF